MTALRPFFLLVGRASVFWVGFVTLCAIGIFVAGVSQPDERLGLYLDGVLIAVFAFPAAAGWLAGNLVQEAQHTSFLGALPGVRGKLAGGYAITGVGVAIVVVGLTTVAGSAGPGSAVLFPIAIASYCFGGVLLDPFHRSLTQLNSVAALAIVAMSQRLSRMAAEHPWPITLLAMTIGGAAFWRLFASSTFRRKPFRPSSPFPGRFFLERSQQFEQDRQSTSTRRLAGWRQRYLGERTGSWLRAAWYESFGRLGPRGIVGIVAKMWGLALLFVVSAWADMGDLPFLESLGKTTYGALFRSPHHPPFGENGGPYPVVAMGIATLGAVTALFNPVALRTGLAYPLSRRQRARICFRAGLVDGTVVLLGVGVVALVIGFLAARLGGYPFRLDFVPYFFRALLATLVLMPVARVGYLRMQLPSAGLRENSLIVVIFGVGAFIAAVCAWVFLAPQVFGSSAVEVGVLAILLVVAQLAFRRWSIGYFASADLP